MIMNFKVYLAFLNILIIVNTKKRNNIKLFPYEYCSYDFFIFILFFLLFFFRDFED